MKEILSNTPIPTSSRLRRFRVELHGGEVIMYNRLSNGTPEAVYTFNGSESPEDRRFDQAIVEGDEWYFVTSGGAKVFFI